MTILMAYIGIIVFICSLFTAGFVPAWKRFGMLVLAGFAVDALIVILAVAVGFAAA